MGELKRGFWEKGMEEFMAVDGTIYKVNPENGIYQTEEIDNDGNLKLVSRQAGSARVEAEQFEVVEKLESGKTRVTTKDVNGRIYKTEIR